MKRFTIFSLAVLLALGAWAETRAQDEPEPADVEENGAVIDHDEDGIDDNKARHHRGSGRRGGRGLGKLGADLTEEQRAALKETVEGLRQSGASREEVHAAVGAQLQSYGVELPENREDGPAKGQRRGHRFGKRGRRGATPPPAETAPAPEAGF